MQLKLWIFFQLGWWTQVFCFIVADKYFSWLFMCFSFLILLIELIYLKIKFKSIIYIFIFSCLGFGIDLIQVGLGTLVFFKNFIWGLPYMWVLFFVWLFHSNLENRIRPIFLSFIFASIAPLGYLAGEKFGLLTFVLGKQSIVFMGVLWFVLLNFYYFFLKKQRNRTENLAL
ncbi:MAG: DUF2878 family protein [Gammaproteobacteria bacterium]